MDEIIRSKRAIDLAEQFAESAWQNRYFVWRNNTWVWSEENRSWSTLTRQQIRGSVGRWLRDVREKVPTEEDEPPRTKPFHFTAKLRDDVVSFLTTLNIMEDGLQAPFDVETGNRSLELDRCIFFKDVMYDAETGTTRPREWNHFHVSILPFDFDPEAPADLWNTTVLGWFKGCQLSDELLHRELGYLLMGFRGFDSIFVHAGKPRAGKGVVDRVQGALLGEENRIALNLNDMGDTFATQGLEYARQIVLSEYDEGKSGGDYPLRLRQLLKQIVGRDPIRVRAMYQGPQTMRCSAVPKIVGNTMPEIPDQAGSVWSKARVLWFGVSHLGGEDVTLEDRLREELPGIARRAAEAAHRLWNAPPGSRWPDPPQAKAHLEEAILLSNPVEAWLRARTRRVPGSFVRKDILYADYLQWSRGRGHRPLSQNKWTTACKSSSFALDDAPRKIRDHDGEARSFRVFLGVSFDPGGRDAGDS